MGGPIFGGRGTWVGRTDQVIHCVLPVLFAASLSLGTADQCILSVDQGAPATSAVRVVGASSIASTSASLTAAGTLSEVFCVGSPDRSITSAGLLDSSGNLSLRQLSNGSWATSVAIATGVSTARPAPIAAVHTARSGTLVIAYAVTGSALCTLKTYNTTLSSATDVQLGLGSTPLRLVLTARPGSDEVLLVAQDASQRLAAAVWDGTTVRATSLLDSAFDGGERRWDAVWPRGGSAMVAWARATDTTLRVSQLLTDTWTAMSSTPSLPSAFGRVMLATDPSRGTGSVAAALANKTGTLSVTTYESAVWSSLTQMTTTLDTTRERPAELAYEGAGGGLVCAWVTSGGSVVNTRRLSGGTWANAAASSAIGTGLAQLAVEPKQDASGVVVLARRETTTTGTSIGTYVAYSQTGAVTGNDRTVFTGTTGSQVSGVSVPAAPSVTEGTQDVSLTWDATLTLAPGSYRDLSFRDRTTLNLSAGTYVFRSAVLTGYDSRFVCNTSSGDVKIIFTTGSFTARDRFTITRSGSGVVILETNSGGITFGYDDVVECIAISHTSTITGNDRVRVTGYLFAVGNVTIGYDATITQPSWSVPQAYSSGGSTTQRLYAMLVSAGSVGSVSELTSSPIDGTTPPPMAVTQPGVAPLVRVSRWREVEP